MTADSTSVNAPPEPVMTAPSTAVVLLSGGLDSTVLLWWAVERYSEVIPLCVDWGQSTPPEQKAARAVSCLAGLRLRMVQLASPGLDLAPGDFTRGHNFSLIGAAGLHIGRSQGDILVGSIRSDRHADATARFMGDATAGLAGPRGSGQVRVMAPLLDLGGKPEVLRRGLELGAPAALSWSCNRSRRGNACQRCVSCGDRAQAWEQVLLELEADEGLSPSTVTAWIDRLGSWRHPEPRQPEGLIAAETSAIMRYRSVLPWRSGWVYPGPDQTSRFTRTTHPGRAHRRRYKWEPMRYIRVTGSDTEPWAVTLLQDGTVTEQTGPAESAIQAIAALVVDANGALNRAMNP